MFLIAPLAISGQNKYTTDPDINAMRYRFIQLVDSELNSYKKGDTVKGAQYASLDSNLNKIYNTKIILNSE